MLEAYCLSIITCSTQTQINIEIPQNVTKETFMHVTLNLTRHSIAYKSFKGRGKYIHVVGNIWASYFIVL